MCSIGSTAALSALASATTDLAVSWWSQKPGSAIFDSSSLRRACLVGKSKRVPDGDDPGAEGFDGLGEVLVDHSWVLPEDRESGRLKESYRRCARAGQDGVPQARRSTKLSYAAAI